MLLGRESRLFLFFYRVGPSERRILANSNHKLNQRKPRRRGRTGEGMKIQCGVCERTEAAVLCCADEAALCWACDSKVHAANKLAGKHERVPLLPNSSQVPTCDICQEKAGYFFCLEDRALLCRHCDVAIHTASPYVSAHQRFLITGVRIALQNYYTNSSNTSSSSNSYSGISDGNKQALSSSMVVNDSAASKKLRQSPEDPAMEVVEGFGLQWPWNEITLDGGECDQCHQFSWGPGSFS